MSLPWNSVMLYMPHWDNCSCLSAHRYIKPGFKLRVEAVHSQALSLMLHTQVYLLSEQEAENIMSWDPAKLFKVRCKLRSVEMCQASQDCLASISALYIVILASH